MITAVPTALLKPRTTELASYSKMISRLYSMLPTLLLAAISLSAFNSASLFDNLLLHVTDLRRQVFSLVVRFAKTNFVTTTPYTYTLVASNPPLLFFVTKIKRSLSSAATFAPPKKRLTTR